MENKNNISKLTKILFVALAMGMILISPYQLCNVAAADKYYGYQKKTKSVKTKITASKKKVRIKKKYRGTRTTKMFKANGLILINIHMEMQKRYI